MYLPILQIYRSHRIVAHMRGGGEGGQRVYELGVFLARDTGGAAQ